MTMDQALQSEAQPEVPTWPERYSVRAAINYHSRRGKSGVMQVIMYQPAMSEVEIVSILGSVGFSRSTEGWTQLISQAKDTFSLGQAEALVAYLDSREGTKASMKAARKPTPASMGASAIPTLPSFRDGIVYRLYTERGYNLPFKVEAINVKTYLYMARLFNEFNSTIDGHEVEKAQ